MRKLDYKRPPPDPNFAIPPWLSELEIELDPDQAWMWPELVDVFESCRPKLANLKAMAFKAAMMDLTDRRPELVDRIRQKEFIPELRALLAHFSERMQEKQRQQEGIAELFESWTNRDLSVMPSHEAMETLHNEREVREKIDRMPEKDRKAFIEAQVADGNELVVRALKHSPFGSSDSVKELSRRIALKNDPTLSEYESDGRLRAEAVRAACSSVYSAANQILSSLDLKSPVTLREHYAVFQPRTELEAAHAERRIIAEERQLQVEDGRAQFRDQNPQGIAM